MTDTLRHAGILDEQLVWTGGDAHLVIVGDILDRGPNSRAAMDLLMRIEQEAAQAGGRLHVLIGNHESMLLIGDMRYVSEAEYAAFADDESDDERARWFARFVERQGAPAEELQEAFNEKYPRGYFAMRQAFRADGMYGKWLLEKNVLAVVNNTAFVHGGLSPDVTDLGADGLNAKIRETLREFVAALGLLNDAGIVLPTDSHYDYGAILANHIPSLEQSKEITQAIDRLQAVVEEPLLSVDGPLWYRENVACSGVSEEAWLSESLAEIGADRLVVGHTPTPTRTVLQRFDGKLVEIDTGMLGFYYKGSGNALVIEGESLSVVNQSGAVATEIQGHPRRVGRRKTSLTVDKLEELLETGEIVNVEKEAFNRNRPAPRTMVTVSNGTHTVRALFERRKGKTFYPAVATYRLDRLLGVDMTPVTVIREVNGKAGSLQYHPDNAVDEMARRESGRGGSASCPLPDQWMTMAVFDFVTENAGRTAANLLYDKSSWNVMLTENTRAFGSRSSGKLELPEVPPNVLLAWQPPMRSLTDEVIETEFSDVLDRQRRAQLRKRRDKLVGFVQAKR